MMEVTHVTLPKALAISGTTMAFALASDELLPVEKSKSPV